MRDSFVFYRSFADAIAGLPPEEYKKVMQAIIGYACVKEYALCLERI